jgi:metallo-beta-lactamase class B
MKKLRTKTFKKTALFVFCTALLTRMPFPVAHADDSGLSVHQITGPLYLVEDNHYVTTNSLVYIGPSSVTVIGATWTPETARLLAKQIKRLTNRPISEVIDPSPDPEWSGGNGYWKSIGAKILAIRETSDLLKRTWTATVDEFRKNFPDYPPVPLVLPTESYEGEFELQSGNIRALYLGPSHTAADIFVYFPKEKVLDAGSILKEQLGNMAKADIKEYPKTLHKLQDLHLNIDTIISGHWSPVHGPELIDHYLQLLTRFEQTNEHNQQ